MRNLTLAGGLLLAGLAWQGGPSSSAGQGLGSKGVLSTAVSQPPRLPYNHPMALLCRHYSTAESVNASGEGPSSTCSEVCGIPQDVEFLFMTVPDPERTHLGILFDRSMEAVIRAATNQNRVFDSYWLPWQLDTDIVERDPDKRKKLDAERQAREILPGILVFRGKPDLVVFLIGESPSWGINKQAFQTALCYYNALKPAHETDPLNVVGPTFSGSFDSLLKLHTGHTFKIRSGTASSATQAPEGGGRDAGYASAVHSDTFAFNAFKHYLDDTMLTEYKIAILHENTQYGIDIGAIAKNNSSKSEVFSISFPRDLSQLRNASPEEVDVNSLSSAEGVSAPHQTLTLRFKDTQTGRDTIPVFAKDLAAVSQESALMQIAAAIRREHVGFAGIAATNVLDVIYIANFLRKACPNTRLFVLDADLLFAHEADRLNLEGMMSITTWPLLAGIDENVLSLSKQEISTESETVFSSRYEQGIYQAVQSFGAGGQPPALRQRLWLTVLGRDGYQPILFLDGKYNEDSPGPLIGADKSPGVPFNLTTSPSYAWISMAVVINLLGVAWLLVCRHAENSKLRWCSDFTPRKDESGYRGRAFFLLAATLSLAAQAFTIGAAAWSLFLSKHIECSVGILILISAIAVPPLLLVAWAGRLTSIVFLKVSHPDEPEKLGWRHASVLAWICFAAFVGIGGWLSCGGDANTQATLFFNWRSLALGSRLSPVVPFLLLLPVFFGWGWVHLQRMLFKAERRPELPVSKGDRHPSLTEVHDLAGKLNATLEEPFFAHPKWMLAIPASVAAVAIGLGLAAFKGFEGFTYQVLYSVSVAAACALIFSAWAHLLNAWSQLSNILEQLELLPIRTAFDGLPPEYSWSPIWQQSARKRSYKILSWSLDCMRALAKPAWPTPQVKEADAKELCDAANAMLDAAAQGKREDREQFKRVRDKLAKIAGDLYQNVLEKRWEKGDSELVRHAESSETMRRALRVRRAEMERKKPEMAAEEFVVLRYLHYIRYAMLQLRNLLTLISAGFILTSLSLNSYPFQSVQMIRGMVTVAFAVLGVGIISVFIQMDRDAILSRITNTKAGQIGTGFYVRMITVGGLPLLTVLASHFPSIGRFLLSWVRPAMESMQ